MGLRAACQSYIQKRRRSPGWRPTPGREPGAHGSAVRAPFSAGTNCPRRAVFAVKMSSLVGGYESRCLLDTKVDKNTSTFLAGLGQFYDIWRPPYFLGFVAISGRLLGGWHSRTPWECVKVTSCFTGAPPGSARTGVCARHRVGRPAVCHQRPKGMYGPVGWREVTLVDCRDDFVTASPKSGNPTLDAAKTAAFRMGHPPA